MDLCAARQRQRSGRSSFYVYGETESGPQFSGTSPAHPLGLSAHPCGPRLLEIFGEGALPGRRRCAARMIAEEVAVLTLARRSISVWLPMITERPTAGEVRELAVPASPRCAAGAKLLHGRSRTTRAATVVRGNAMGLEAELAGELAWPMARFFRVPHSISGASPVGRHIHYNIPETWPERAGVVCLTSSAIFAPMPFPICPGLCETTWDQDKFTRYNLRFILGR